MHTAILHIQIAGNTSAPPRDDRTACLVHGQFFAKYQVYDKGCTSLGLVMAASSV